MRPLAAILRLLLPLGIAGCVPAFAALTVIATPAGSYTGGTTLLSFPAPNCLSPATITSLSGGGETVGFSSPMTVRQVATGPGFCGWATWGAPPATEGSTPVVATTSSLSVTMNLSMPASTFGFETAPAQSCPLLSPCPYLITASFYGAGNVLLGTVPLSIDGNVAALEAASSTTPITSVVVTAAPGSNGFAIAQVRFTAAPVAPPSAVPAVRTAVFGGLALLLAAAGSLLARAQARDRAVRP